ncbi:chlororespiratory reduction protein 7 [Tolypothrix sp. FACHB-123]|uniref:chlororespiratory reduction protein 7 n=1 Tax=Tolypothrix sp. FACHB-123 TaxID=2692868 RepID=UPI0016858AD2|nr:chlororespiratory reduction protein 7 [Tolypothrix sp. FACHB-123]MBD2354058.1 chlororespiratory reduction protein 7 [Tolypothrix sp. FACHB-123]
MPDSLMYAEDYFVVLETNQPEQFLTASELLEKLKTVLQQLNSQDLPPDVQKINGLAEQAKYLKNTSCELDLGPGEYLQWYAVRLEK